MIRVLHRLAGYDLSTIDNDVIGHVYGGYVEDEHKHESGMYYTPPEVVEYILDGLGYSGPEIVGTKILDPASGSGTFLVSAARRLVQAHRQYHRSAGHVDIPIGEIQTVLDGIKNSLYGLDLNPFACYLAETNLLIQVLDLIKRAFDGGESVTLDRFHVYNADTLSYEPELAAIARGTIDFSADELELVDQLKIKRGKTTDAGGNELDFGPGFDFVVANPPYVRADEGGPGMLEYRRRIREEHPVTEVREVLVKKWDLFVPFVALGWHLLGENGRLGMITSNGIEMVPYAQALRKLLSEKAQVDEVSFFPNVRLFDDAAVENTVFFATKKSPDASHEVVNRWHSGKPPQVAREERRLQATFGEHVFRQAVVTVANTDTVRLEDICYISKGMVLHANEKTNAGEFDKDDLISQVKGPLHPVAYIEGKNIDAYAVTETRYLEYGSDRRVPAYVSRPTFSTLYNRPKIMRGRTSSAILDNGCFADGWLYANHSVIIAARWCELAGIENRSIAGELQGKDRAKLEHFSEKFLLHYLLGVINSDKGNEMLTANRSSVRAGEIEPKALKSLPVRLLRKRDQVKVALAVRSLLAIGKALFELRKQGWFINTETQKVEATATLPDGVPSLPLATAKVRWSLRVHDEGVDLTSLSRRGSALWRGRKEVISVPESAGETGAGGLEWLRQQFAGLSAGTTWGMAEVRGARVPQSPGEAVRALAALAQREAEVREKVAEFGRLKAEVDVLVAALYEGGSVEAVND